jgi:hypothetical protein
MQQLLAGLQGDAGQQLMQPLPPVPAGVLEVLRRALAAGWCDQVTAGSADLPLVLHLPFASLSCVFMMLGRTSPGSLE